MSKKILIVEDSFAVSIVMERMVEKLGYTFKTVYKGEDAINAAKNIAPDLVIMDIMLPGSMDGIDAARELAKNNIPFIYNSEYTEDSIIKRAKATDPLGYLVKPLNFENFKIAIEMAFEKIEIKKKLDQETRERERAMLELKELNEELRHFTFGASHDLQEPLRTITCFSELILEKHHSKKFDDIPELTQFILNASNRMQSLIESLLSYSGLNFKAKPFQWLASKEIIDNAVHNLDADRSISVYIFFLSPERAATYQPRATPWVNI